MAAALLAVHLNAVVTRWVAAGRQAGRWEVLGIEVSHQLLPKVLHFCDGHPCGCDGHPCGCVNWLQDNKGKLVG